jgi:cysteine dioxygenase
MDKLIQQINSNFNQDIKLDKMREILENYTCDDWIKYVNFQTETYNKNIVYLNDNFKIIVISWKNGQESPIHDHPNNGCLMKVISGSLIETKFIKNDNDNSLHKSKVTIINTNEISYIEGNKILHKINTCEDSVSIHIYSPSNYVPQIIS